MAIILLKYYMYAAEKSGIAFARLQRSLDQTKLLLFFEATQYGMCAHPVPDKDLFFSCKYSINKSESCYAHFLTTFTISKAVSLKNGHA